MNGFQNAEKGIFLSGISFFSILVIQRINVFVIWKLGKSQV